MPSTAMSAPGIFRLTFRRPTMMAMTAAEMSRSPQTAEPRSLATLAIHSTGPEPVLGNPKMLGTWPTATWMPTPVRNPMSTLADRKLAMKPSRSSRARMSRPAANRAMVEASATHWADAGAARPAMPAAMMAAVAESAPTTRCLDDPKMPNRRSGHRMVYRPVMTGISAIEV